MAALRDEVKRFIVQALACYDTPTQVSIAVKEEYGLDVGRQQVAAYDPTKHAGRSLSQKWTVLFNDTREKFRETTAMIPIAQQSFRLRALERIFAKAENMRNLPLAMQALEQAAKETGEAYVNRRSEPPKAPGTEEAMPAAEYILSPDENVPERPIL